MTPSRVLDRGLQNGPTFPDEHLFEVAWVSCLIQSYQATKPAELQQILFRSIRRTVPGCLLSSANRSKVVFAQHLWHQNKKAVLMIGHS